MSGLAKFQCPANPYGIYAVECKLARAKRAHSIDGPAQKQKHQASGGRA